MGILFESPAPGLAEWNTKPCLCVSKGWYYLLPTRIPYTRECSSACFGNDSGTCTRGFRRCQASTFLQQGMYITNLGVLFPRCASVGYLVCGNACSVSSRCQRSPQRLFLAPVSSSHFAFFVAKDTLFYVEHLSKQLTARHSPATYSNPRIVPQLDRSSTWRVSRLR